MTMIKKITLILFIAHTIPSKTETNVQNLLLAGGLPFIGLCVQQLFNRSFHESTLQKQLKKSLDSGAVKDSFFKKMAYKIKHFLPSQTFLSFTQYGAYKEKHYYYFKNKNNVINLSKHGAALESWLSNNSTEIGSTGKFFMKSGDILGKLCIAAGLYKTLKREQIDMDDPKYKATLALLTGTTYFMATFISALFNHPASKKMPSMFNHYLLHITGLTMNQLSHEIKQRHVEEIQNPQTWEQHAMAVGTNCLEYGGKTLSVYALLKMYWTIVQSKDGYDYENPSSWWLDKLTASLNNYHNITE